ncbi:unnamed protein product [Cladocopium goreaui]|uniref:Tudor domain-containing protein 1 n=1 Tax=Cladocopium goreaui TaxID=2562237 RepID=A0A9P1CNM5_9DINO|nr:unnamed protein product [Cladocopium goreaui]
MTAAVTPVARRSPWTHNVICGIVATAFYRMGAGLYMMTVLPSFILLVGGNNFDVGFAEGLQGLANLLSAMPAGYIADKWSRRACIRMGTCLTFLSAGCLLLAVIIAKPKDFVPFVLLCLALALQGICDGIINGPLAALMDDSCPAGRRSDVESMNASVGGVAASVGPLLGLIVFATTGNTWTTFSMKVVICVGIFLSLLAIIPCLLMHDKYALAESSEAVHLQKNLLESQRWRSEQSTCFGLVTVQRVCIVMFINQLILTIGAGMTVKFFPVFFKEETHLKPVLLQAVFGSLNLFAGLGNLLANRLSKKFGRLQVIICGYIAGITCTMLMGTVRSYYTVPAVMLPIFLTRCICMWSCTPLLGSIIADYTPKATRGRWKALSSVAVVGWSGSAAVGGWLIDHTGFGVTFIITACFQTCSIPIMCILLPLVAKESELLAAQSAESLTATEISMQAETS